MSKENGQFKKGFTPWNKGKTRKDDVRIPQPWLGKKRSEETKNKISKNNARWNFGKVSVMRGKHHTKEARKKISKSLIGNKRTFGHKASEETKRKMSEALRGKKPYVMTEEIKKKISESSKGEKSSNWLGGKSFEPYSVDWTKTFKISIRERDKYICQLCGEKQCDYVFAVHHIDYNKKNCNPDNLITLCFPCHAKTNINRNYWISYFKQNE